MKTFTNEQKEIIMKAMSNIISLAEETADFCNSNAVEELNDSISYFSIDGRRFKLTLTEW
jgi:hypothetical protein